MRNKERCRQTKREGFNNLLLFLIPHSSFLIPYNAIIKTEEVSKWA